MLLDIFSRVRMIETDIAVIAKRKNTNLETRLALHHKLYRLTLQQHAVLTAILVM